MRNLIDTFRSYKPFNEYNEEYKWELLDATEGKESVDFIKIVKDKQVNLYDNRRVIPVLDKLVKSKANELTECVNHLLDESKPLDERLADFKLEMQEACKEYDFNNFANDERTASVFLTCKYPEKYAFYKDGVYKSIWNYFGFEHFTSAGKKYSHFLSIINMFSAEYGEEIQQIMLPQIDKYKNKPLNLAVQTLFWCMRDYMDKAIKEKMKNIWLVGYTFDNASHYDSFTSEGVCESIYIDGNQSDQKLLSLAKKISEGDVIVLKSTSTKGTNHDQPFIRIKAIGIVTSENTITKIDGATKCSCKVNYINKEFKDFDGSVYGSYRKTIHQADSKIQDIVDYVNSIINNKEMKYQEYIDLLKENHNLVLTGAPGTGKTYMAHAIAKEMGAETMFVQFHPSYDYTDFVEGLRPVDNDNGQIAFERKDGVFKDFCKRAIKNLVDSEKTIESLAKEISWQEKLDSFVEDAIEQRTKYETLTGNKFIISEFNKNNIVVFIEQNEKVQELNVNADVILELLTNDVPLNKVKDIKDYYKRTYGTAPDSYAFVIIQKLRAMKQNMPTTQVNKIDKKPFVCIIDEINRGEASKIFGELFYAIDPGYRGNIEHMVQTQYQNLVPEGDVFKNGFYVPDNVYILATMNDIDRSVESMDFAMRRRFTWKEVTPADTENMLDVLPCAKEAKECMTRLNNKIAETKGLGAAYMIGPSYFLKLKNGDFDKLLNMNLKPLLKEYLRGFRDADNILEGFEKEYFGKNDGNNEVN